MKRRSFLTNAAKTMLALASPAPAMVGDSYARSNNSQLITVFLCGDVMTGRGIDQILPHPSDPRIYEPYMRSAQGYVSLAERRSGPLTKPVDFAYIWGDALEELDRLRPDVRIVNLETSVTKSEKWVPKGINYRMHPDNVSCITTAKIDCCSLANNHILDWSEGGLIETLETLERVEVKAVGAGRDLDEASAPGILEIGRNGRVIVFAFGSATSGIPHDWAASGNRPGVNFLEDLSDSAIQRIRLQVRAVKRPGDVVIASVHWGSNWGYHIPAAQKSFAHKLLDDAGVDVVHGHSSHHPKGIEVYNEKPILYGCGDFLNDYEGISGHEEFRSELVLMYLISVDPSGEKLVRFEIMPLEIKRFRLNKVIRGDAEWLRNTLDRECKKLGTRVELNADNSMKLRF